jgi:hypothetical protein
MSKVSKLGVALVFSLLLVLAVSTTSGFAQSVNRNVDQSNISALAHAAVLKNVAQGIVSGIQHPNGNCNGGGWGGGCNGGGWGGGGWGGGGGGWGGGWGGGGGGWNGGGGCGDRCGGGGFVRCSTQTECHFTQQCFWSRWGRSCRSIRICRKITICHRDFNGWGGGGWDNNWAVKRAITR